MHHLPLNVAIEAFDAHGLRGQNDRMLGKYAIKYFTQNERIVSKYKYANKYLIQKDRMLGKYANKYFIQKSPKYYR